MFNSRPRASTRALILSRLTPFSGSAKAPSAMVISPANMGAAAEPVTRMSRLALPRSVWPLAASAVFARAASTRPLIVTSSAPAPSTGAEPPTFTRLLVPSATSASTLVRPPARRPLAAMSIAGSPLDFVCGETSLAMVTFQSPVGAFMSPPMRASPLSAPSSASEASAMFATESGMARAFAMMSRRSPTEPSISSRPPPMLTASPLMSVRPAPVVTTAGPASESRWPPRCALRLAISTRMRSPGVSKARPRIANPRASTATSSAAPAPSGFAVTRARVIVSLPTRTFSTLASPSSAGRRNTSRPAMRALRRSSAICGARMAAPLAVTLTFCPPAEASSAISALNCPASFCSAMAERSSRSGADSARRPVASCASSSVTAPFSVARPMATSRPSMTKPLPARAARADPRAVFPSMVPSSDAVALASPRRSCASPFNASRGTPRPSAVASTSAISKARSGLSSEPDSFAVADA